MNKSTNTQFIKFDCISFNQLEANRLTSMDQFCVKERDIASISPFFSTHERR